MEINRKTQMKKSTDSLTFSKNKIQITPDTQVLQQNHTISQNSFIQKTLLYEPKVHKPKQNNNQWVKLSGLSVHLKRTCWGAEAEPSVILNITLKHASCTIRYQTPEEKTEMNKTGRTNNSFHLMQQTNKLTNKQKQWGW